jgi:hippurate hydrolase
VPVTYNDPALAGRVKSSLVAALGARNVVAAKPEMVSEDFGLFGLAGRQIPICMFRLGATDPERLRESRLTGKPLPSLHSSRFAPVLDPALRTGVTAMTSVVVDLMSQ